jgi:DNA-binding MarR family transcriptional regulator
MKPAQSPSASDLAVATLVLELIHVGYGERPATAGPATEAAAHYAKGAPRVSKQGVRAAIHLYVAGALTMGELAAKAGMSAGWASKVVDELVAAGYVERHPDPTDRRIIHVRLAPDAIGAIEQAYSWRGDAVERALSGLDPAGRQAVHHFLARLMAELSAQGTRSARRR